MDVIETTDIRLAAYAMARGGELTRVARAPRVVFCIEGHRIEEAEIDYAHFGPRGVRRETFERQVRSLRVLWGARS